MLMMSTRTAMRFLCIPQLPIKPRARRAGVRNGYPDHTRHRAARKIRLGLGLVFLLLVLPLAGGCAARLNARAWEGGPESGRIICGAGYDLHTTVDDDRLLLQALATLEEARRLYDRIAPLPAADTEPRKGYVFAYRDEWVEFTSETAGMDAKVYLQISRGGYARDDIWATFYHGGPQTLAVIRHEGLHQHVGRFKRRPPPFLEEGLATLFEAGFEGSALSRPRNNGTRHVRLVEAARRKRLWPLRSLLTMHAGDVIRRDHRAVDTFYAQAWALGRMLVESDDYRPRLANLLAAYAAGEVGVDGERGTAVSVFEEFFGRPFSEIEADYEAYVRELTGQG